MPLLHTLFDNEQLLALVYHVLVPVPAWKLELFVGLFLIGLLRIVNLILLWKKNNKGIKGEEGGGSEENKQKIEGEGEH